MYTAENNRPPLSLRKHIPAALLLLCISFLLHAELKTIEFTATSGLKIKIIPDDEMGFVHARLILFSQAGKSSPSLIPYLTLFCMLEEKWKRSSSDLSAALRKLGNDFSFSLNPEYTTIEVNFLSERSSTFAGFVQEVFGFSKSLTLKRFWEVKSQFFARLKQLQDWEREIAYQIAFHHILGDSPVKNLMTPGQLTVANLSQVTQYFRQNILPNRSLLVIRGNVNPYQMFGLLEKALGIANPRTPLPLPLPREAGIRNIPRQIYIVPISEASPVKLFIFNPIPSPQETTFLSYFVIHYTLFHYPFGRLYHSRLPSTASMPPYPLTNEIIFFRHFNLICNRTSINPGDVEGFLSSIEQEKRRVAIQNIKRTELASALIYLQGKSKTNTARFENEVELEIYKSLNQKSEIYLHSNTEKFQRISLDDIGSVIEEYILPDVKNGTAKRGAIVMFASEKTARELSQSIKAEIIHLFE